MQEWTSTVLFIRCLNQNFETKYTKLRLLNLSKFFYEKLFMKTNFIILLAVFFIIEIYVYQAIRNITTNNYIRIGYWVFTLLAYGIILYWILTFNRASRDHQQIQLMVSAMMIFVLPKLLSVIFLLIGDFTRFVEFGFKYFTAKESYFPERR